MWCHGHGNGGDVNAEAYCLVQWRLFGLIFEVRDDALSRALSHGQVECRSSSARNMRGACFVWIHPILP